MSQEQVAAFEVVTKTLRSAAESPWQLPEPTLGGVLGLAQEMTVAADAARVGVTREACERGAVAASTAANAADWVSSHSPGLPRPDAARVAKVAEACRLPGMRALADAVTGGTVGLRNAATVLTEFDRLEPRLTLEAAPTVLAGFVQVAADGTPRDIRALRAHIIARYGREEEFQLREDRLKRQNALSTAWEDDGMRSYLLRLDPEAAAVLEAALDPLAVPRPSTVEGPDLRSSDQRRAEALVEIVRRGVAAAVGVPVTDKATLVITMDADDLRKRTGAGTTLTGELLAPRTVRRLACDAKLVPVVLGSNSEPLDVGRAMRLATPGQLRALWVRDGGCTFPGCTRPPTWCDAHHVIHWVDGGPTSLDNMTLLCAKHHTKVHQWRLTATIAGGSVTWHQ